MCTNAHDLICPHFDANVKLLVRYVTAALRLCLTVPSLSSRAPPRVVPPALWCVLFLLLFISRTLLWRHLPAPLPSRSRSHVGRRTRARGERRCIQPDSQTASASRHCSLGAGTRVEARPRHNGSQCAPRSLTHTTVGHRIAAPLFRFSLTHSPTRFTTRATRIRKRISIRRETERQKVRGRGGATEQREGG